MQPGGMLGTLASAPLDRVLGFTGATLLLLFVAAIGFSLFSGLSWLDVAERLGVLGRERLECGARALASGTRPAYRCAGRATPRRSS